MPCQRGGDGSFAAGCAFRPNGSTGRPGLTGQRGRAGLCAAMRRGPPRSGNPNMPRGGNPNLPRSGDPNLPPSGVPAVAAGAPTTGGRRGGPDRAGPRRPGRGPAPAAGGGWLHGLHPVVAALATPARRLKRLLLTEDAESAIAAQLPNPWRIAPERVERAHVASFLPEDSVHQGAALLAEP